MAMKSKTKEEPLQVEVVTDEIKTDDQTQELAVVEETPSLPDYAILNPEIPMSTKVGVATNVANCLAPLVRNQG